MSRTMMLANVRSARSNSVGVANAVAVATVAIVRAGLALHHRLLPGWHGSTSPCRAASEKSESKSGRQPAFGSQITRVRFGARMIDRPTGAAVAVGYASA